jgi:hypothetical protein
MKKVSFFILVFFATVGYIETANADCYKNKDGKVVCNYTNVGGGYEQDKCKITKNKDDKVYFNGSNVEYKISDDNTDFFVFGGKCSPNNAPKDTGYCIENTNDTYELSVVDENGDTKVFNTKKTACAAKYCNDDSLLYVTNTRKEIPVIGKDEKVGSQGRCRKKSELSQTCDAGCGCDEKTEKCVLNEVTVKNHNKDVKAFIGEEMCICQKIKQDDEDVTPDDEPTNCFYEFNGEIKCKNGNSYSGTQKMPIPKKLLNGESCEVFKKKYTNVVDLFNDLYTKNFKEVMDWYEKLCSGNGGSGTGYNPSSHTTGPSQAQITSATNSINTFFNSVKEDRSVWKTVEGKFNTARLASDLTAGVVLGTVGGVVSGVVIKKKQIEKGFEVLHCTVGGQKMADWGDEFTVRFIR